MSNIYTFPTKLESTDADDPRAFRSRRAEQKFACLARRSAFHQGNESEGKLGDPEKAGYRSSTERVNFSRSNSSNCRPDRRARAGSLLATRNEFGRGFGSYYDIKQLEKRFNMFHAKSTNSQFHAEITRDG